jgi:hypothetical protein
MSPEERNHWYAITMVASGVVMIGITNQTGLGEFLTIIGGLWILYLERERIRVGVRKFLGISEQPRGVQGSVSPVVVDLGLEQQIDSLSKQAPRHITADQRKKFRDSLEGKTPIIWETFCVTTDSEADSYAKQLTRMFRDAGMNSGYSFSTDIDSDTLDRFGLTIHHKSGEFPEDARALAWAFDQAGIKYALTSERVVPHADPRYVGLRIGRKPE